MDSITILYWHWLVAGMVMIVAEIFIASFTIFWFGLGAALVGILLWIGLDLSMSWQLFIWVLSSAAFTLAWFKIIKPLSVDRTMAGMSREAALGERGMLTKGTGTGDQRGEVRFQVPLLGSESWPCISSKPITAGETVAVTDVMGNTLVVAPIRAEQENNKVALENQSP